MNETEKAYIAGFFDGEGTISLLWGSKKRVQGRRYYPAWQIVFTNSDRAVLSYIQSATGFGNIMLGSRNRVKSTHWGNLPYFDLRVTKLPDVLEMVKLMIPYAQTKKLQLEICKETFESMTARKISRCAKWNPDDLEYFRLQIVKLKAIKPKKGGREPLYERPAYCNARQAITATSTRPC